MENNNLPAVTKADIPMVAGQGLQPQNFDGLWRLSTVMAASGVLPPDLRSPEAVFVTLNMGAELGLSPMAAVQNISVIKGRPVVWGDALLGLVRASGLMTGFSETFTGSFPDDDFTAVCTCKRGGEEITRTFSIGDARAAGLWQYPTKGVTPWHKFPKRMLQMRARSWTLRDGFGDVLKGIAAREELDPGTGFDAAHDIHDVDLVNGAGDNGNLSIQPDETTAGITGNTPANGTPAPDFDALVNDQNPDDDTRAALENYLEHIHQEKGTQVEQIKQIAAANFERFWTALNKWRADQVKDDGNTPENDTQKGEGNHVTE
ncbi:MAG: hypothetical protein K9K21_01365 [Desulfotignum sp.]|nr:hypothetical protein [Desulfotignum sp.]